MIKLLENDNYYIFVDTYSYALRYLNGTRKNGEPIYRELGWYSTLAGAIKRAARDLFARNLEEKNLGLYDAIIEYKSVYNTFAAELQRINDALQEDDSTNET